MPEMYSEQRTRLLREMIAYDPLTGLFTWKVDHCRRQAGDPAGSQKPDGYVYLKLLGQTYGAHRVAWMLVTGNWPGEAVDHRDGVRSNNAWGNLRLATRAQNNANVPPRGASGLKGATFNKREQRWKAQICIRGKQTSLGTFLTAEQAHAAYVAAAEKHRASSRTTDRAEPEPIPNLTITPAGEAGACLETAMSIPVSALKDDELLHYAALDPGAANELARRIADNSIDPSAEREELREEIRDLESQLNFDNEELRNLRYSAGLACTWIRRAMNPEDRELSLNELLQKALDCLE